jgi:hypothetical protein
VVGSGHNIFEFISFLFEADLIDFFFVADIVELEVEAVYFLDLVLQHEF